MKSFLTFVYNTPSEDFESSAEKYVQECKSGRDWFKDLLQFASFLSSKPPKTASTYMAGLRSFLEYALDVELTKKQAKVLRSRLPKGNRARTVEGDLTREVLRKILAHCDVRGRALFLFLASSGVRIGSALRLKLEDVDLSQDPPLVVVRGEYTKAGDTYFTFISTEAKEALQEWMKVRGKYLEAAGGKSKGLGINKPLEDGRIFPFNETTANKMWALAVRKAGLEKLDPSTKRRTYHIHMLRKFFISQLKLVIPEEICEALAGHNGYLDDAYRRYTRQQIAEYYKKGEPYLYVSVPKEISEIQTRFNNEVEELRRRLEDLTQKLADANTVSLKLMMENSELRARVDRMGSAVEEQMKALAEEKRRFEEEKRTLEERLERLEHLRKNLEKRILKIEQSLDKTIEEVIRVKLAELIRDKSSGGLS
ncbi:MAG: tyrosine-type recombinase/integrase [Candidatus Methanomethyliaceae archaeon]